MSDNEYATGMARYEYRLRARNNLQVPAPLREFEYEVEVVRPGGEVLEAEGLTLQDVLVEPRHLLVGEIYRGGATLALDPFHPATPELAALRLADGTGDPSAIHEMIRHSSAALRVSGVPDEVGAVHPTTERAEEFSAMDVIAVMPDLGEMTGWRQRACAAYEMLGALVAVPRGNPARSAIREYAGALANPGVSIPWMEPYVNRVLGDLAAWGATHARGGWGSLE